MENPGRSLLLIGGGSLVIGALLPWVTLTSIFGTVSFTGIEGDGILSAAIGLVVFLFALIVKASGEKRYGPIVIIAGILALIIILPKFGSIGEAISSNEVGLGSIGVGLYLSALAGILVLVGGLVREPRKETTQ